MTDTRKAQQQPDQSLTQGQGQMLMRMPEHGGTDAGPPVTCDFSTNAHPLGPPPAVLDAVLAADRQRYPDPAYTALRQHLSAWHGVAPDRVLPTSGGAEAIRRITLAAMLAGVRRVCVPQPGFGDYAAAAHALGLTVVPCVDVAAMVRAMDVPCLVWICDPNNPTGRTLDASEWAAIDDARQRSRSRIVVDQAYEPLRLHGAASLPPTLADLVWRLICPNKALGLTGVRAAYLLAPLREDWRDRVAALAASWVLSAEGEALLTAWAQTEVQEELADSHALLRDWVQEQQSRLASWGFQVMPGSVTPFWMARLPELGADNELDPDLDLELDLGSTRRAIAPMTPTLTSRTAQQALGAALAHRPEAPPATPAALLAALRHHGIKLRDATSFGLPGWVRLSVQTPASQMALLTALHQVLGPYPIVRRRLPAEGLSFPPTSEEDPQ